MQGLDTQNKKSLSDLLKKIKVQYELLGKIPLSPKFYEVYAEYRNLADEIEEVSKIDSSTKIEAIPDGGLGDSFFGYITLRVVPLIFLLQEQKKAIFTKLPENDDEWFKNLQFHFLKLAKMQGDIRLSYWFGKTEILLNDFLDQVKTTEKGNELFLKTNVMNVMHEIFDLLKAHEIRKELQASSLEAIRENDIHTLVMYYKKMNEGKKSEPDISLKSRGEIGIMSIYSEQKKTKEELMTPVHIFQAKLPDTAEQPTKIDFDEAQSVLHFAGKEIRISKRAQSDPHDLLVTIFKDRAKVWNTDEVLEDWKLGNDPTPRNKVYQAGKALNNIVAKETQIKDFLNVDTKEVSINKAYLKE